MPLHFNSFSNERNSSQLDVGVLTTTLYILGGGLFYLKIFIPPVKPGVYFAKATNNAEIH